VAPIDFDSPFAPELLDQASTDFVRGFLFKRYGAWLVVACVVNLIGFALVLWLGGANAASMVFLAGIAVLGPVYLFWTYHFQSARIATRLKQYWVPAAHFSLGESAFSVTTSGGSASVPWSRVKALLEFPAYFMLVFSPFAFIVLPKASLPEEGYKVVREKAAHAV